MNERTKVEKRLTNSLEVGVYDVSPDEAEAALSVVDEVLSSDTLSHTQGSRPQGAVTGPICKGRTRWILVGDFL